MIRTPPKTIMDVFESLPEGTLAQIINNNLVMSPAPDFQHQDIVFELAVLLRTFVTAKNLGKVVGAPVDVYFDAENVYQPDLLFLSNERLHLVQNGKIKGAPDLIIEVLSPGTERVDKTIKKSVYEQAGVHEYWIVNPKTKAVFGYRLQGDRYVEMPAAKGLMNSVLLDTTLYF